MNAISVEGSAAASHPASASMSAAVTADPVFVAEQVLEEDLQREGQAGEVETFREAVEPENLVLHAIDVERRSCAE